MQPGVMLISVQKPPKEGRLVFPPEWETFREKILSLQHYTFYFVYVMARNFADLSSYYVKLSPPFFNHLKTFVCGIIDQLDSLN